MIASRWLTDMDQNAIRELDPLDLDAAFQKLPDLNRSGDHWALREILDSAATRAVPASLSVWEALAAMRDLGILAASLRRLSGTSMILSARTAATLVALGEVTDMPPRETVIHYTHWNPDGPRRRTFTGAPEEAALMTATSLCLTSFEDASRALLGAKATSPACPSFARACRRAAAELAVAARTVQSRGSSLDPQHFATELRAYFQPIVINGRAYNAAAAAQAPLYLVDECVLGREAGDTGTWRLRDELADYGLPRWRAAHQQAQQGPSILEKISGTDCAAAPPWSALGEAAAAARAVLEQLLSFRGRHRRLVTAAYKPSVTGFDNGSAGADLAVIDTLLTDTRNGHRALVEKGSNHPHLRRSSCAGTRVFSSA